LMHCPELTMMLTRILHGVNEEQLQKAERTVMKRGGIILGTVLLAVRALPATINHARHG
jgi:hypothetical protein